MNHIIRKLKSCKNTVLSTEVHKLLLQTQYLRTIYYMLEKIYRFSLNCHNQIIIDKGHPLAPLIIKHFHKTNLHCGHEQTLSSMRQQFWIPSCRVIINKVLKRCSYCKRRRAKPQQPFMSNILSDQLAVNEKPFSNSGVDYFGPIVIKSSRCMHLNPASAKRQGVLFTCLATHAVHFELGHDMSTDAFLLALYRFISRRGFVSFKIRQWFDYYRYRKGIKRGTEAIKL